MGYEFLPVIGDGVPIQSQAASERNVATAAIIRTPGRTSELLFESSRTIRFLSTDRCRTWTMSSVSVSDHLHLREQILAGTGALATQKIIERLDFHGTVRLSLACSVGLESVTYGCVVPEANGVQQYQQITRGGRSKRPTSKHPS